jgi:hypothetical protein
LELICTTESVATDEATCEGCGYKFKITWRLKNRQKYIYSQIENYEKGG